MLPGIPHANSKPLKLFSKAAFDTSFNKAPLWAVTQFPSVVILFNLLNLITTPEMPPSLTKILEPLPNIK